uniref:Peptidase S1 domain-containing protein n=1 Tax=Globodera rostochiensis TaxID=31243 RepID=A0A914HG67_GLORO
MDTTNNPTQQEDVVVHPWYPWIVFVQSFKYCANPPNTHIFVQCTGALISENYVITAAYCVRWNLLKLSKCLGKNDTNILGLQFTQPDELFVRAGSSEVNRANRMGVSKISVPELFEFTQPEPRRFDIALIRLKTRLQRQEYGIPPICLSRALNSLEGQMATTVGWELKDYLMPNTLSVHSLSEERVPILARSHCPRMLQLPDDEYNQFNTFVCAGKTNRSVISGIYGNPMQIKRNGRFYLVGLSSSSFIKPHETSDIYANVSSYCGFISAVTRSEVRCLDEEHNDGQDIDPKCGI